MSVYPFLSPTRLLSLLVVFTLVMMATPSIAWGPISHGTFNCLAIFPNMTVADCLQQEGQRDFAIGSDAPDSFGFTSMFGSLTPSEPGFNLTYVHDPVFGGYQLLYAMNQYNATADFDAVLYSQGFVSHIIGDLVGFHVSGGILCTSLAGGCTAESILYMPEWGFMSSLDAYFYANHSLDSTLLPTTADLPADASTFVAEATAYYHGTTTGASFPAVSAESATAVFDYWGPNMDYVFQRAQMYAQVDPNQQFLLQELSFFISDVNTSMPTTDFNTFTPPTGVSTQFVEAYIEAQVECVRTAIQYYMQQLSAGTSPEDVVSMTVVLVGNMYEKGLCVPPTGQRQFNII